MPKKNYKDSAAVNEYMSLLPKEHIEPLTHLRKLILSIDTRIVERIAYNWPTFRLYKDLVLFASFKKHMTLFVRDPVLIHSVAPQLDVLEVKDNCILFTPDKPIPDDVVRTIVERKIYDQESSL